MNDSAWMRRAIALSADSVATGGGPFGALIVRGGRIIGEGINRVVPHADPTAHAEIVAIRDACRAVGSHALDGATIYATCEPCPMCLAAIWWARIGEVVYGNTRDDAARIGFDDAAIYREVSAPIESRALPIRRLMAAEASEVFEQWLSKADRVAY